MLKRMQALGTPNNLHARFNAAASNGDVGGYNPLGLASGLVERYLSACQVLLLSSCVLRCTWTLMSSQVHVWHQGM